MNKLDSKKDKQCALEDEFLVASCLVANEGGDNDCADSEVVKKLRSMSMLDTIFYCVQH